MQRVLIRSKQTAGLLHSLRLVTTLGQPGVLDSLGFSTDRLRNRGKALPVDAWHRRSLRSMVHGCRVHASAIDSTGSTVTGTDVSCVWQRAPDRRDGLHGGHAMHGRCCPMRHGRAMHRRGRKERGLVLPRLGLEGHVCTDSSFPWVRGAVATVHRVRCSSG